MLVVLSNTCCQVVTTVVEEGSYFRWGGLVDRRLRW